MKAERELQQTKKHRKKEKTPEERLRAKKRRQVAFRHSIPLYIMLLIPITYFLVFSYAPMGGISLAFKKYNIFKGIWDSPWVGFDNFKEAFGSSEFRTAIKNTLVLNLGELVINFPFPIVLAILINEVSHNRFKKITQLVLYLPHFLSMVVVAGIVYQVFASNGIVNNMLGALNISPVNFLGDPIKWRFLYWGSGIWKGAGYGMIVYLAAMAGINIELYDAAYLDGAGRWKRIWHVTLPQIRSTIVIMTIMNVGKILSISFERPYLMGNVLVKETANVISTYVYNVGLQAGRYDFATAVGLFQSVVAVVMVLSANQLAKRLGEEGIL